MGFHIEIIWKPIVFVNECKQSFDNGLQTGHPIISILLIKPDNSHTIATKTYIAANILYKIMLNA